MGVLTEAHEQQRGNGNTSYGDPKPTKGNYCFFAANQIGECGQEFHGQAPRILIFDALAFSPEAPGTRLTSVKPSSHLLSVVHFCKA